MQSNRCAATIKNEALGYDVLAIKRIEHANCMSAIQGRGSDAEEYEQILRLLEQHMIPEQYPSVAESAFIWQNELGMDSLIYRDPIVRNSSFALISNEWVRPLAQWIGKRHCLEIMSGSGALAYALTQNGVTVIATDNSSWAQQYGSWFSEPWQKVEQLNCLDAIERYGGDCELIVCSWPYMDEDAYSALIKMRAVNPTAMMIYIGEWSCGATASDSFFEAASIVNDAGFASAVKNFKQVYGIHDWPYLLR